MLVICQNIALVSKKWCGQNLDADNMRCGKYIAWLAVGLIVGVYIWICVLDYLNKTQDSRSFGAKPPCQDLMKIWKIYNYFSMKNKNKNITTKFRKSKSGGKSGVVSALDYTRLLPSVQYVKNRSCSATITITIDHEGHQRTNPNALLVIHN